MGIFQNRPQSSEQDVWNNVISKGDYCFGSADTAKRNLEETKRSPYVRADYVFGRMMKLTLGTNDKDVVESSVDDYSDTSYHSFGNKYPDSLSLFKATAESLGVEIETV